MAHDDAHIGDDSEGGTQVITRPESQTKTPKMYRVIILNDDFTPRDFVVHVLQRFFRKNEIEATQLMLDVHNKGSGVAGVFTHEIAETKAYQVNAYSRENKYPLKTTIQEA
ncbi:MAG: ATP-dependent Clp protease adapter ClpS [Bdellovibrionaceae bacterium]|nr:ATP-dependent Clp protease adapter ClpS [Pseudobdellovibrionaceae bacterium]